jgi:hypothetical protein
LATLGAGTIVVSTISVGVAAEPIAIVESNRHDDTSAIAMSRDQATVADSATAAASPMTGLAAADD